MAEPRLGRLLSKKQKALYRVSYKVLSVVRVLVFPCAYLAGTQAGFTSIACEQHTLQELFLTTPVMGFIIYKLSTLLLFSYNCNNTEYYY